MSTLSNLDTKNSLQSLSNESLLEMEKINKIRKKLLNLEKKEVATFSPLEVKTYKEKKDSQKNEFKIKVPVTFKSYFEDYKKYSGFIYQVESGLVTPSSGPDSVQVEQINSSDLVNSD